MGNLGERSASRYRGLRTGHDRLSLSLNFTPPGRFGGNLNAFTYFDRTFRNTAGAEIASFDGYTTVDGILYATLDNTRLSLSVSNIFDQQYFTYHAQAATNANRLYFAGSGRTFTLRAEYSF